MGKRHRHDGTDPSPFLWVRDCLQNSVMRKDGLAQASLLQQDPKIRREDKDPWKIHLFYNNNTPGCFSGVLAALGLYSQQYFN